MPETATTSTSCRVYWGSHGCSLLRGHNGPHMCECALDDHGNRIPAEDAEGIFVAGGPPYYGNNTRFYGEDVT